MNVERHFRRSALFPYRRHTRGGRHGHVRLCIAWASRARGRVTPEACVHPAHPRPHTGRYRARDHTVYAAFLHPKARACDLPRKHRRYCARVHAAWSDLKRRAPLDRHRLHHRAAGRAPQNRRRAYARLVPRENEREAPVLHLRTYPVWTHRRHTRRTAPLAAEHLHCPRARRNLHRALYPCRRPVARRAPDGRRRAPRARHPRGPAALPYEPRDDLHESRGEFAYDRVPDTAVLDCHRLGRLYGPRVRAERAEVQLPSGSTGRLRIRGIQRGVRVHRLRLHGASFRRVRDARILHRSRRLDPLRFLGRDRSYAPHLLICVS